jgi:hypothetical protein
MTRIDNLVGGRGRLQSSRGGHDGRLGCRQSDKSRMPRNSGGAQSKQRPRPCRPFSFFSRRIATSSSIRMGLPPSPPASRDPCRWPKVSMRSKPTSPGSDARRPRSAPARNTSLCEPTEKLSRFTLLKARTQFSPDSPVVGTGFEPMVPRQRRHKPALKPRSCHAVPTVRILLPPAASQEYSRAKPGALLCC